MYYNMKMKTTQRNLAQMLQYLTSDREKILRIPHERLKSLYHMVKEVRFKVFMLGLGGKTFFQTLPPSFYILRLDLPSLITQLRVGPPSLRIFYDFRFYF